MRGAIPSLIQELQGACRLSLYNGNQIGTSYHEASHDGCRMETCKRRRRNDNGKRRNWETILGEVASHLPSMSAQEHGQVSKLASLLLLGFLLPHASGNEFFLLQNVSTKKYRAKQSAGIQTSEQVSSEALGDYVIDMPLDERLECVAHSYNPGEFGELNTIVEDNIGAAFVSFVRKALHPFLAGRPAHAGEVDLLHILAMAIHPHPSEQPLRQTTTELEEKKSDVWVAAKRLMNSLVPHSFHVNYNHRLELVKLVAESLVLPEYNKERAALDAPMFEGALPHLRASLYAFGMAAMNPYHSHWSQCGLVTVAIQTGDEVTVKEEWGRLLNRLMDDRTDYRCCHNRDRNFGLSLMKADRSHFCPHRARGQLLETFLTRFSQARHYAEPSFLQHALASLTDAIEFKVDCWTKTASEDGDDAAEGSTDANDAKTEEDEGKSQSSQDENMETSEGEQKETHSAADEGQGGEEEDTNNEPPCILESLLVAAKPLFYFLLPVTSSDDNESKDNSEENQHRDMLVSCCIQLVHHGDGNIAHEASRLLVLAFSYGVDTMMSDYAGAVFQTTKVALEQAMARKSSGGAEAVPIEGMVAAFAQKSTSFGEAVLSLLLSKEHRQRWELGTGTPSRTMLVNRLIAAISMASPAAAWKNFERITELVNEDNAKNQAKGHLLAALLSCRWAFFFAKSEFGSVEAAVKTLSAESGTRWQLYQLGRHALTTGNFAVAQQLYKELSSVAVSESSFLWYSVLENISTAEECLSTNGAKGIPSATTQIRSAVFSLNSMTTFGTTTNFEFQTTLLNLRLDLLDVVGVIRQLTREMRLTGAGPQKFTRPNQHLRNSVKLLKVLASKYLTFYRQRGLFACQQSRTTVRTLFAICRFLSSAVLSAFIDVLPEAAAADYQKSVIQALTLPKGDTSHPITVLMKRLDSAVLKDMNGSTDPQIRAAALLEIVDAVLKVPAPFPRGFLVASPTPHATLKLSATSDLIEELEPGEEEFDEEMEVCQGTVVSFCASGTVPEALVDRAQMPFSVVLLWHTVAFRAATKEEDKAQSESQDDDTSSLNGTRSTASSLTWVGGRDPSPTAVSLSPSGAFFARIECEPLVEDGHYSIETKLGCRDIRGGEWEFFLENGAPSISVRVSSSRG